MQNEHVVPHSESALPGGKSSCTNLRPVPSPAMTTIRSDDEVPAAQSHTMRDRHRETQRRYRERRRRYVQDAEQKIEELTRELQKTRMQRDTLQCQFAAMISGGRQSVEGLAAHPVPALPQPQQQPQAKPAVEQLLDRTAHCSGTWWLDGEAHASLAAELGLSDVLILTIQAESPLSTTAIQLATMDPGQVAALVERYVQAIASNLMASNSQPSARSPTRDGNVNQILNDRLECLASELEQVRCSVLLAPPEHCEAVQKAVASLSGNSDASRSETEEARLYYTRDLLPALQLSDLQAEAVKRLRRAHLGNLGLLLQRRSAAAAAQLGGNLPQWCPRTPQEDSLRSIFAETATEVATLRQIMKDELRSRAFFEQCLWRCILTPQQAALLHVQSHPHGISALGLVEHVAVAAGCLANKDVIHAARVAAGGRPEQQPENLVTSLTVQFRQLRGVPAKKADAAGVMQPAVGQ